MTCGNGEEGRRDVVEERILAGVNVMDALWCVDG